MNKKGGLVNTLGGKLGVGVGLQPPRVVIENNQATDKNKLGYELRMQDPLEPQYHNNYMVIFNIADS